MAVAVQVGHLLTARVRWPNDLSLGGRKVGGILTEVVEGVPIVGIGLNLHQTEFPPDLAPQATSLRLEGRMPGQPLEVAQQIEARLNGLRWPMSWSELQQDWQSIDDTPGKLYKFSDGRRGTAIRVGVHGELICMTSAGEESVLAADALYSVVR